MKRESVSKALGWNLFIIQTITFNRHMYYYLVGTVGNSRKAITIIEQIEKIFYTLGNYQKNQEWTLTIIENYWKDNSR